MPDLTRGIEEAAPAIFKRIKYQDWYPGNAIEEQQEDNFESLPPSLVRYLRAPLDPGLGQPSPFYNGVVGSFFPVVVGNTASVIALIENRRRAYLFIQNLGPGNLFVQFGQAAALNLCAKFVPAQTYEPNPAGLKGTLCPIRNSVNVIADAANTTVIVGEATWVPT
jgi:hypothetical protein